MVLRLVWKDVAAARWVLLAGVPLYALNLAALTGVRPVFLMVALAFSAVLAFGSLAVEEIQGTTLLWASLPVRRRQFVIARYLTAILGAAAGIGISLGVDRAMALVRLASGRPAGSSLATAAALHGVLVLLLLTCAAVLLPLCFRLGAGNGALAFGALSIASLLVLALGGQGLLWLAGRSNPLLDPGLYSGAPEADQVRAAVDWLRRWGGLLLLLWGVMAAAALTISAGLSRRFFELRDLPS